MKGELAALAMKGLDNEICEEMLWLLLGWDRGVMGLIKGIYLERVVVLSSMYNLIFNFPMELSTEGY